MILTIVDIVNVCLTKSLFRSIGLLLLAGLTALNLRAQSDSANEQGQGDYLVQNWQTDQGLPRTIISAVTQDQQGYLWFGTPYGVIRFDGVRFLDMEANVSPDLAQGSVQGLFSDRAGNLWIATRRSGLFCLRNGRVTRGDGTGEWPSHGVDSLAEDGQGAMWAVLGNGQLGRLESGRFVPTTELSRIANGPMLFTLTTDVAGQLWFSKQDTFGQLIDGQPTNYMRLPSRVITLAPSRYGGMWVSTGSHLCRLAPGRAKKLERMASLEFGTYGVTVLHEDKAGGLWIGTLRNGLYRFQDGTLEKITGVRHMIRDILEDAEGNIWVATDGAGIFKVRRRFFKIYGEPEGLRQETVVSVSGDWAAPRGGGLGRIQPSGSLLMLPEHEDNSVVSVLEDPNGGAWIGTAGSLLIHRSAAGVIDQRLSIRSDGTQLRVLTRDHQGNLWIGGFASGLFRQPANDPTHWENLAKQGFPEVAVTAIAEDAGGTMWIGAENGTLYCYTNGGFQAFGASAGFSHFPIGSLLTATNGGLWVGTMGGGLGRFQNGQVKFLGQADGLLDDGISQLIGDDSGWLWLGGSRGISRVRVAELDSRLAGRISRVAVLHYGKSDGLANVQCTAGSQPSVWRTREGWLRFATSRGVVSFDPASLPMNLRPPPLILEGVLVDGAPISEHRPVELPHNFKKLEFRYTAASFVAPEKVLFKRRLLGFDEGWIDDGQARSAIYPQLAPGHYAFEFTACNDDGVWNDDLFALYFDVVPAFWQTAWFRAVMVVAFAGLIGGGVLLMARVRMRRKLARLEQANALERERTRISRDLHDDLGARLTQMALLADLICQDAAMPGGAQSQIGDISRLARNSVQSLDETVWLVNPRKDTLTHLVGYIARYAEQYFQSTRIRCLLDVPPSVPACTVTGNLRRDVFLLVKEALHNVLKHAAASEVRLRFAVRGSVLRILVQDNGRGFNVSQADGQRHGLENLQQRAAAAGIRLLIHSSKDAGTRVIFRVRLPSSVPRAGGF